MSILDSYNSLSLEAKNTVVSEFSALVNNASAAVSSTTSTVTSQLGSVVSTAGTVTSKYTTSTMSKLSSYAKNTKFVGKTVSSAKSMSGKIVSGALSNTATAINQLSSAAGSTVSMLNNHISDVSQTLLETKLDKDLYDKALNLPEAKTVSLYLSSEVNRQYGKFVGSTVFKDFNGTIDDSIKNVQQISGWVTLNNKSENYAWITNNGASYIVGINSVQPQPIVENMQPLYDKLKENQYATDELVVNDVNLATSKAATFKEASSKAINSYSEDTERFISGTAMPTDSDGNPIKPKSWDLASEKNKPDTLLGVIYPKQVKAENKNFRNDSVYNNIQAVVYDLALGDTDDPIQKNDFNYAKNMLLCYQQPENISYTAAAQFDSPAPRGSQQPFQFYITANAMNLSFTLKWHIDEIRTLTNESGKSYSIQDIAQIAEDFTRPWKRGNSLEPKLCKVILPGVQHIGYITEAQIAYSGDMSGDYTTAGGVLSGKEQARSVTNYFYSQIDVTFSIIIIKDITLQQKSTEEGRRAMYLEAEDHPVTEFYANQENAPDENNEAKDNSGNQEADPTGPAAAASGNANESITNEVQASDGFDFSDMEPENLEVPVYDFDVDETGNLVMFDQYGNVYTAEENNDGFFVDDVGNEMFMANGYPQRIIRTDEQGNKYYLNEDAEEVKAEYTDTEDDHIDTDDGFSIQIGP